MAGGVGEAELDLNDVDGMGERALQVLQNPELGRVTGRAAASSVKERFSVERVVPMYEEYYKRVSI